MSTHSSAVDGRVPRLSVIVPVRPDTRELAACLAALTASDLARADWELIVVTSVSDQDSWLVSARDADTVVRLPDGSSGAAYARNRGVEVSRASYLLFISADVCVAPNALRRCVEVLDTLHEVGAVCGTYVDDPQYARSHAAGYQNLVRQFSSEVGAGVTDTFTTGFGAIRRELFLNAGMFDEWRVEVPHIESAEFGRRLLTLGHRVIVRPDLRATHLKQWTLWRTLVQSFRDPGTPWRDELCIATTRAINPGLRVLRRIDAAATVCVWSALAIGGIAMTTGGTAERTTTFVLLVLTALLCLPLCLFAARRRSIRFALMLLPIHFAKLLLAGFGITWNWIVRHVVGEPRPAPAVEAFAEVGVLMWPPVPQRRSPRTDDAQL